MVFSNCVSCRTNKFFTKTKNMNSILLFVLLQLNLFGNPGAPLTDVKLMVEDASTHEIVAFVKVGRSGQFLFSNLDPGNYFLHLDLPQNTAKKVDKKVTLSLSADEIKIRLLTVLFPTRKYTCNTISAY